jgi:hypothetical protein
MLLTRRVESLVTSRGKKAESQEPQPLVRAYLLPSHLIAKTSIDFSCIFFFYDLNTFLIACTRYSNHVYPHSVFFLCVSTV